MTLEDRVAELEEVVALQNALILELNRIVGKSGSATSEDIPVTKGDDGGAAVAEG